LILSAACATLPVRKVVEPLERSLRRLREFELDASLELRGPLAAMAANAEMELLDCGAGDRAQRQYFGAIMSATDQLQRLVEDLLTMARQEQGEPHQVHSLDLGELVRQQVAIYNDALTLWGQRVQTDLESGLVVHGHAGLLHQLVRNLLDNAHRYSPEGSLIRGRVFRKRRQAFLEVSDEGPGISAEDLPRVFDRF
jgi:OmpR-family two-component system manganese-sensing sensor histidine kinase